MKLTKTRKNNQLNSDGFTLLEVLIAVIILAIVCIPVFRSFVTSANTTAKSKLKMRATNAAENIMEDIQHLTLEEIEAKYGTKVALTPSDPDYNINPAAAGASAVNYKITLAGSDPSYDDDINKVLDDGYEAVIVLDPSWYTNTNRVNMPNYAAVDTNTAAIYNMAPTVEKEVCKFYADKNEEYRDMYPSGKLVGESDFPNYLKREIRVDIKKSGTVTDSDGNTVDKVTVNLTVSYLITEDNIVDDVYRTRKAVSRQLFSNAVSKKPLNAIFIMYDPLYKGTITNNDRDIIIVHNHDDVETNLYICAQNVEADAEKFSKYIDKTGDPGLILEIYENEITGADGNKKQPITLRTNVIDSTKVEYLRDETIATAEGHIVPIQCYLNIGKSSSDPEGINDIFDRSTYNKIVAKKGSFADKADSKALNAQSLDGKTLDASTIEDRIYDVKVRVTKPTASAEDWPVSVELTGSLVPEKKDE